MPIYDVNYIKLRAAADVLAAITGVLSVIIFLGGKIVTQCLPSTGHSPTAKIMIAVSMLGFIGILWLAVRITGRLEPSRQMTRLTHRTIATVILGALLLKWLLFPVLSYAFRGASCAVFTM